MNTIILPLQPFFNILVYIFHRSKPTIDFLILENENEKQFFDFNNFFFLFFVSCSESNPKQEGSEGVLKIQGEETDGMGPGPGVDFPHDTAGNIIPDTIIID